jgi:hypothetical protein
LLELRAIVCRDANQPCRADDLARLFDAQVFLPDMNAARASKSRNVGAVIYDK